MRESGRRQVPATAVSLPYGSTYPSEGQVPPSIIFRCVADTSMIIATVSLTCRGLGAGEPDVRPVTPAYPAKSVRKSHPVP